MNPLTNLTIKTRLIGAFSFVLVLFVIFGVFSLNEIQRLGGLTRTLYDHPLQVSNAALKASMGLIKMHRSMKDVASSLNQTDRSRAARMVDEAEEAVYENLSLINQQILGSEGKALVAETERKFAGWKPIRDEVFNLALNKEHEAEKLSKGKSAQYVAMLERQMLALTTYARSKADGFMANAESLQQTTTWHTILYIALVALAAGLVAFFLINSILGNLNSLNRAMTPQGDLDTLTRAQLQGRNEIVDLAAHFNKLLDRLEEQLWRREGLNQLNQQLSGAGSLDDLTSRAVSCVSRYVAGCAGALFSFDAESGCCDLMASYAFVEREFLSHSFKLGEGVVGQVALEKSPILLRNIKPSQAEGVSGTASEPVQNLYALPLLYESGLYGVLEVGSFNSLGPVKLEYLDAAARIIGAAMFTLGQSRTDPQAVPRNPGFQPGTGSPATAA